MQILRFYTYISFLIGANSYPFEYMHGHIHTRKQTYLCTSKQTFIDICVYVCITQILENDRGRIKPCYIHLTTQKRELKLIRNINTYACTILSGW